MEGGGWVEQGEADSNSTSAWCGGARPVTTRNGLYQGVLRGGGREWGAECTMVGGGSQVMVAR